MSNFNIKRIAPDRVEIALSGDLTVETITTVTAQIGALRASERRKVLIDFRGLQSCGLPVRSALVAVHKQLKDHSARIAYIADSSLMRGLALWLCHLSEDENAKPFAQMDQAEQWLRGDGKRVADTHTQFRAASELLAKKGR